MDPGPSNYAKDVQWTFEPDEAIQVDLDGYATIGRWRVNSDTDHWTEIVRKRIQVESTENHNMEENRDEDSGSDLFGRRDHPINDIDSRASSPLFGHRSPGPARLESQSTVADESRNSGKKVRSPPPTNAVSEGVRSQPDAPSGAHISEEVESRIRTERTRDLSILESILEQGFSLSAMGPSGRLWFQDDDEDEVDETGDVLRLRGGVASSDQDESDEDDAEDSEASADSSDDDNSDETTESDDLSDSISSDDSDSESRKDEPSDQPVNPQTALKDMFAPTSGGFSLMAQLGDDIEMDESLDIPISAPGVAKQEPELEPLTSSSRAMFTPDPSEPLFFASFADSTGEAQAGNRAKSRDIFQVDREKEGWKGFWAQESDAEMKEIWQNTKLGLTHEWKRRHREAKKHRRRRGGAGDELE